MLPGRALQNLLPVEVMYVRALAYAFRSIAALHFPRVRRPLDVCISRI